MPEDLARLAAKGRGRYGAARDRASNERIAAVPLSRSGGPAVRAPRGVGVTICDVRNPGEVHRVLGFGPQAEVALDPHALRC